MNNDLPPNELSRSDCLDLVRTASVGRVGLTLGALPLIVPVGFLVDDSHNIVFGTDDRHRLHQALDATVVAFETGSYSPGAGRPWSVLVQGVTELHPVDAAPLVRRLPRPLPHADGDRDPTHVVLLRTDHITGRWL